MTLRCWQVDAFTDRPFGGNPAAVVWLTEPRTDDWLQSVAAEMNLSETAFVTPTSDGMQLRWFTPTVEVDLCGHATLASAYILWESNLASPNEPLRFHTKSGTLICQRRDSMIEMNFPTIVPEEVPLPEGLLDALRASSPSFAGKTRLDWLIEFSSPEQVRNLKPDFRRLAEVPTRGVIVTARSDDDRFDFISRFFAPAAGIDEDPATGSAHCSLTPYWASKLNKKSLTAYQASRRGAVLYVQHLEDRVQIAGQAVTVWSGELH